MTMTSELENALRLRFPVADIRSDQCDTVRVISATVAAGCRVDETRYTATVISLLADDLDYDDEVVAEFSEQSPELLVEQLAMYF